MKKIKQFLKQGAKPILYVLVGFILGIAIYTAHAAWDTTVVPTQPLTADLWNDIVAKLVELDNAPPVAGCNWEGMKCSCDSDGGSHRGRVVLGVECDNGTVTDIEVMNISVSSGGGTPCGTSWSGCDIYN